MPLLAVQPLPFRPATRPGLEAIRLWGMSHVELHDRYWASLGVQIIRRGRTNQVEPSARLYLLLNADELVLIDPAIIPSLEGPPLVRVDVVEPAPAHYSEQVEVDDAFAFRGVRRRYPTESVDRPVHSTLIFTRFERAAEAWLNAPTAQAGRRSVREHCGMQSHWRARCEGVRENAVNPLARRALMRQLLERWTTLDHCGLPIRNIAPGVWAHETAQVHPDVRCLGPAWIGAGVVVGAGSAIIGPDVIGDELVDVDVPAHNWASDVVIDHGFEESLALLHERYEAKLQRGSRARRVFDIAFSLTALTLTAPLFILAMIAIWIEDGRPFFFAHRRQSIGGREFSCHKFRTMHRNADAQRDALAEQNICDGPQFFIRNDPRVTRVGRILRRTHLDEIPQFFDVLRGDMSIVGPRPSPDAENQFCPTWRDARLAVKPGLTGLWQIRRSRQPNTDFQEWIRYDLEYVRRRSWKLDLEIMVLTALQMLGLRRS